MPAVRQPRFGETRQYALPKHKRKSQPKTGFAGRTVMDVTDEILRIFGSDEGLRVVNFQITVATPSDNFMDLSWRSGQS